MRGWTKMDRTADAHSRGAGERVPGGNRKAEGRWHLGRTGKDGDSSDGQKFERTIGMSSGPDTGDVRLPKIT